MDPIEHNPLVATVRAMFSLPAIGTALLGVLAAISLQAWQLIPVGMIAWALVVYLSGPYRAAIARRSAAEKRRVIEGLPPRLRPLAEQINASMRDIKKLIGEADDSARVVLAGLEVEIEQLEWTAQRMLNSARALHEYLSATSAEAAQARAAGIRARIAATQDEFARRQLQEALAEVETEISTRAELEVLMQRVEASVRNMQSSLSNVHSHVVKMTSGDIVAEADLYRPSFEHLEQVRGSVAALREVIDTTISEA